MTDTERLDWLEHTVLSALPDATVVLRAWFSKPGDIPDHFGIEIGTSFGEEDYVGEKTLREMIDIAAKDFIQGTYTDRRIRGEF